MGLAKLTKLCPFEKLQDLTLNIFSITIYLYTLNKKPFRIIHKQAIQQISMFLAKNGGVIPPYSISLISVKEGKFFIVF